MDELLVPTFLFLVLTVALMASKFVFASYNEEVVTITNIELARFEFATSRFDFITEDGTTGSFNRLKDSKDISFVEVGDEVKVMHLELWESDIDLYRYMEAIHRCSKCDTLLTVDSAYCNECGEKVITKGHCPGCNNKVRDEANFCEKCGTKINSE